MRSDRGLQRTLPSFVGVFFALAGVVTSMSPSLLPRTWATQGLVSGLSAIGGYGIGVLLGWLARTMARTLDLTIKIGERQHITMQRIAGILVSIGFLWATVANIRSQRITALKVQMRPLSPAAWAAALLLMVVVFIALLALARGLRAAYRAVVKRVGPRVPRFVATVLAATIVVVTVGTLTNVIVIRNVANHIADSAAKANAGQPYGRTAPTSPLLSGGPGSVVPYNDIGFEGKRFVTGGPPVDQIAKVTGGPALQPIRVYASADHYDSLGAAADAVVMELKRTKAFDRKVLAVFTTTGTGWIDAWSAQGLEYVAGGDCAIASMQYSNLSSFAQYVADQRTPIEAATALFDRVYAAWSQLPADRRPQLVVSGESLGAYGGNGAFANTDELLAKVQGAVWTGTPLFTPNLTALMNRRAQGSPQIQPVVDNGDHIRFGATARDLTQDAAGRPYGPWTEPRIAYLQHPSDPVVWWSPNTLFAKPDWLREPRGADVNPNIHWFPYVTFWQLTTDMGEGLSPPYGHGHKYGAEVVAAWAAVIQADPARVAPATKAIKAAIDPEG